MNKYILGLILLIFNGSLMADSGDKPRFNLSIGVGVPNLSKYIQFVGIDKNQNDYYAKGKGPFHFKAEYKSKWWLGLGFNVNYMSYKITYMGRAVDPNAGNVPNQVTISNTSTAVNLHANLHLMNPEHYGTTLDVYWGLGLGYKFGKFKVSSQYEEFTPKITLPNFIKMGFETTVGLRYFFTKNIAAYTELGIAKSIFQLGVTGAF